MPAIDDADRLLKSAVEHRMTGLLWSAASTGRLDLPARMMRPLAQVDAATSLHHRRLWETVEAVTGRLRDSGIVAMPFKGVVDELRWFDRVGERPCSDVDLVLKDASLLEDALAILAPKHPLRADMPQMISRGQALSVDIFSGGVHIDLHVDPLKIGRGWRRPDVWLEHTQRFETPSGVEIEVFDGAAAAALRLIHLGKDYFRYLIGIVEGGRLLSANPNWGTVAYLGHMEGMLSPITIAQEVVSEVLHLPGPLTSASDWRARLWRRLWRDENRLRGDVAREQFVRRPNWLLPLTRPGMAVDTLIWLAYTAFPPPAQLELRHPGGRGPYLWKLVTQRTRFYTERLRKIHITNRSDQTD